MAATAGSVARDDCCGATGRLGVGLATGEAAFVGGDEVSIFAGNFTSGLVNGLTSLVGRGAAALGAAGLFVSIAASRCFSSRTGVVVAGGVGFDVTTGRATGRTSVRTGATGVGLTSGIALGATTGVTRVEFSTGVGRAVDRAGVASAGCVTVAVGRATGRTSFRTGTAGAGLTSGIALGATDGGVIVALAVEVSGLISRRAGFAVAVGRAVGRAGAGGCTGVRVAAGFSTAWTLRETIVSFAAGRVSVRVAGRTECSRDVGMFCCRAVTATSSLRRNS